MCQPKTLFNHVNPSGYFTYRNGKVTQNCTFYPQNSSMSFVQNSEQEKKGEIITLYFSTRLRGFRPGTSTDLLIHCLRSYSVGTVGKPSPLVDNSHCVVMVQFYRSWQLVRFKLTDGKYHTIPLINPRLFVDRVANFIVFSRLVTCNNRGNPFLIFR